MRFYFFIFFCSLALAVSAQNAAETEDQIVFSISAIEIHPVKDDFEWEVGIRWEVVNVSTNIWCLFPDEIFVSIFIYPDNKSAPNWGIGWGSQSAVAGSTSLDDFRLPVAILSPGANAIFVTTNIQPEAPALEVGLAELWVELEWNIPHQADVFKGMPIVHKRWENTYFVEVVYKEASHGFSIFPRERGVESAGSTPKTTNKEFEK